MVPGAEDLCKTPLPTAGGTSSRRNGLNVNTLTVFLVCAQHAKRPSYNGRWLVAQITTAGDLSGTLNAQIFLLGVGGSVQQSWDFAGGEVIIPCDGELDECGVCNGPGIAEASDIAVALLVCPDCDGNCILTPWRRHL